MAGSDLSGFTVGVTADRRADEQSLLLARLGVEVLRGPTIRTLPVADDVALRAVTEAIITTPPDYVVANTGVGMRGWLEAAASWGLAEDLRSALGAARIAARGPKAAGAVQTADLPVWWQAPTELLATVGERLIQEPLVGARVAIQLHGDDRQSLGDALRRAGAEVIEVPVYRWTLPDDTRPAHQLIQSCIAGAVDAVTFTAAPAFRNLMELAASDGQDGALVEAFNAGMVVACVGPVCAGAAVEAGVKVPVVPARWRLGSLVRAVAEELATRRRAYRVEGGASVILQGSVAAVDGRPVRLTERERAVLGRLADQAGGTVSRAVLLRDVWEDPDADPHVLETVIARLRAKLGPAGDAIETSVRRGYRFSVQQRSR